MAFVFDDEIEQPKAAQASAGRYVFDDEPEEHPLSGDTPEARLKAMNPPEKGPEYDPYKDVKTLGRAVKNFPGSAYDLGKNTLSVFTKDPVDVLYGVAETASGGMEKLIPGEQEHEKSFDALVDFYKQRYGTVENFRKTFEEDPAGFVADMSAALGGAGTAVRKAGDVGKVEALTKAGTALQDIAVETGTAPYRASGKAIKETAKLATKLIPEESTPIAGMLSPERLYGGATKMPLSKKWVRTLPGKEVSDRRKAIGAGLEEGTIPTERGWHELQNKMDAVNRNISDLIASKKGTGDTISTREALKPLDDLKADYDLIPTTGGGHHGASDYIGEIEALREATLKKYGETIPVDVAQKLKQQLYGINSRHYGELKGITVEAQKSLARGLKEELAKQYPDLAALNAKDSALIKLNEGIERAIGRIGNRDVIDLGTTTAGAINKKAGLIKFALDNPYVKARLAIALHQARKWGRGTKTAAPSYLSPPPPPSSGGTLNGTPIKMPQAPESNAPVNLDATEKIFSPKTESILNSSIPEADKERFLVKRYEQQGWDDDDFPF